MSRKVTNQVERLAQMLGARLSYFDMAGKERRASTEELLAVIRALGVPIERGDEADEQIRRIRHCRWNRLAEPVAVAWNGRVRPVLLRLPAGEAKATLEWKLQDEETSAEAAATNAVPLEKLPTLRRVKVEGEDYIVKALEVGRTLALGYHELHLSVGERQAKTRIIAAPEIAYEPEGGLRRGAWGVFMPLYALRSQRNWGIGDLTDMERLMEWVQSQGGSLTASLPLFAAFLRGGGSSPFEPSPYSPASRLFYNEIYVDPTRIPELERSPEARALMESAEFQAELAGLRASEHVDYPGVIGAKRRVLEILSAAFFANPGERERAYHKFLEENPLAPDYAAFRAVVEARQESWPIWPEPLRGGKISESDYDKTVMQYHLYVQWITTEQLGHLERRAAELGDGLYMDMPLGVNPDSYDVWRGRKVFALECAAGAPPDPFFAGGQDWGFPPLHPERSRDSGYNYFIGFVRRLMQQARILRIDHVMGLHRLYWIPRGMNARQGVYVQYNDEEHFAIMCLESHRNQTVLVGEDLGTVPPAVRNAMNRHRIRRMYIQQFFITGDPKAPLGPADGNSVASLNTHDMPTWAGLWHGRDIEDRVDLKLLDDEGAQEEFVTRTRQREALKAYYRQENENERDALRNVMRAAQCHLADSDAAVVLLNLEDIWLEQKPQNVPGTWHERPNWLQKAAQSFEEFSQSDDVVTLLAEVNRLRKRREGQDR